MTDNDSREAALATLKAEVYEELDDLAAGVTDLDPVDIIERAGILAGLLDAEAGRMVPHEQAMEEIRAVIDAARRAKKDPA